MPFANPNGRDFGPLVNWDGLAKLYAAIILIWTTFLLAGVTWLVVHRDLYFLKIRNISLAIASTLVLQLYIIKLFTAYSTNGHFPCGLEYWIMGLYLPLGIGLFQLNIAQIHSVSSGQTKLLSGWSSLSLSNSGSRPQSMTFAPHPCVRPLEARPKKHGIRGLWTQWCEMTPVKRTQLLIGAGMSVQVIVTLAIYLGSRKFHPSWGSFGPSSHILPAQCRRGGEWVPTAIWQLVFSWGYGPYTLYKIRNVKDVHFWRVQIVLCVVSGLPGTPLWLASLYSYESFKQVNKYWIPSMWIAPGLMVMQFCTLFFPIYEGYSSHGKLRRALDGIKASGKKWSSSGESSLFRGSTANSYARDSTVYTSSSQDEKYTPTTKSTGPTKNRKREIYSRAALEKALAINPTPLLEFASQKDFTGENITFLMCVRQWRTWWDQAGRDLQYGVLPHQARRQLFRSAVEIFLSTISEKTSAFPINISSKVRVRLEDLFAGVVWTLEHQHSTDSGTDIFNTAASSGKSTNSRHLSVQHSKDGDQSASFSSSSKTLDKDSTPERTQDVSHSNLSQQAPPDEPEYAIPIPAEFNEHIFDDAESEVKYMVITNTWPRFVDSVELHEDMKIGFECV